MHACESVTSDLDPEIAQRVRWDAAGLLPAVVQDATSGAVLMVAWMSPQALHLTLTTGYATYWSRSRRELWRKGETSGHVQHVRAAQIDCDGDTLLLQVEQVGPACHRNTTTCFDGGDLRVDTPTGTENEQ